jgi:hypothetical protein
MTFGDVEQMLLVVHHSTPILEIKGLNPVLDQEKNEDKKL